MGLCLFGLECLERICDLRKWLMVGVGALMMLCLGTVYSYSVFRPEVAAFYGVNSTWSGVPYMTALASYALFMFLTGLWGHRFSARSVMVAGSVMVGAGWLLSSQAQTIVQLTVTYGVVLGAGVGVVYGVPIMVMGQWFGEKKGLATGIVLGGFGLSPLLTAPVAKALLTVYGLHDTFFMLGVGFSVILVAGALFFVYKEKRTRKRAPLSALVKQRTFKNLYCCFTIATMIGLLVVGLTTQVGETYFSEGYILTLLMSLFAVFNGFGRPLFGAICDRLGVVRAMRLSLGLIAFATVLMVLPIHHKAQYIVAFGLYWLNLGAWLAIAPMATVKAFGETYYATFYGLIFTGYGVGALAGVTLSGVLYDRFGSFDSVFVLILILSVAGLFLTRQFSKVYGTETPFS